MIDKRLISILILSISFSLYSTTITDGESFHITFEDPENWESEQVLGNKGFSILHRMASQNIIWFYAYSESGNLLEQHVSFRLDFREAYDNGNVEEITVNVNNEGIEDLWFFKESVDETNFKLYVYVNMKSFTSLHIYTSEMANENYPEVSSLILELLESLYSEGMKP